MNQPHCPVETAVKQRYAAGAQAQEAALCCPVDYDPQYLKVIPQEVIERDYGCGDPSQHVRRGETVLDLGSGTGKICFIASQVVGPEGRVIGVDMTDAMLEVARRNAPIVAERIGHANVEFRKGRIQDLALDLEKLDAELRARPIASADAFLAAEELAAGTARETSARRDRIGRCRRFELRAEPRRAARQAAAFRGNLPRPATRRTRGDFRHRRATKKCPRKCRTTPSFGAAASPAR